MNAEVSFLDEDDNIDFTLLEAGPTPPGRDAMRLLQSVISEIATLAGPIATASSLLNAAEAERRDPDVGLLETILPPEPVVYPAVIAQIAQSQPGLVDAVQHFHARLAFARKATLAGLASSTAGARPSSGLQTPVLADVWRELCLAAIDVIDEAGRGGLDLGRTGRNAPRLRTILSHAGAGQQPCIMADGSIEIPGIAEKRQQPRYAVAWQAWLSTGGEWMPVTLFDISRGGIGASCELGMVPGQELVLLLDDRQMPGRVAWAVGGRFAVQLDTLLADDDPLMRRARAPA